MDDPKQLGRELAEQAYDRIRDQGLSGAEAAALFAQDVAQRARQMLTEGKDGKAISNWVGAAAQAYTERLDELTG
jgi:hypothetical protein